MHFAEGANAAQEHPVEQMVGPGFVIDVSAHVGQDFGCQFSAADIEAFEAEPGRIPEGAIVLLDTGRAGLHPDREAYLATAERGDAAGGPATFPGLGAMARSFWSSAGSTRVGIDTPSIGYGQSADFATQASS